MNLDEAKRAFPIGQKVVYQPTKGLPDCQVTEIHSEPWAIGSGHVVIRVKGVSGGVSVEHLMTAR